MEWIPAAEATENHPGPSALAWCFIGARWKGQLAALPTRCFLLGDSGGTVVGQGVWSAIPQAGAQGPSLDCTWPLFQDRESAAQG